MVQYFCEFVGTPLQGDVPRLWTAVSTEIHTGVSQPLRSRPTRKSTNVGGALGLGLGVAIQ